MEIADGEFLIALSNNRTDAAEAGIDADLVASAVLALLESEATWRGTASKLLDELTEAAPERTARQRQWPKTPAQLGDRLRRISNLLPQKGVSISHTREGKNRTRIIELRKR